MKAQLKQKIYSGILLVQAFLGMFGSLYMQFFGDPVKNIQFTGNLFPSGGGFEPCELCWFSRIWMYPMFLIILIGLLSKDKKWPRYTFAMSLVGMPVAIYQWTTQMFPDSVGGVCGVEGLCARIYVDYFGFVTIPFLAALGFLVIAVFSGLKIWTAKE